METNTKENGKRIKLMVKVNSGKPMVISMMASGKMIRSTALAYTRHMMARSMLETGLRTCSMEMVKKRGLINLSTRGLTAKGPNMVKACINMLMARFLKVILGRICFMDKGI